MNNASLKSSAARGMFWVAIDRFGAFAGQFVVGVLLARLLTPEDFGLIGMLAVFMAISQAFIDSGMASGLIQKIDRTDEDFSTVFIFNFFVSLAFYCILFLGAPYISEFYGRPQLTLLTRVLGLDIVINSLAVIQRTKLTILLDFKTMAKVSIVRVFCAGIFGVVFAAYGYGVWALVFQTLLGSVIATILFWLLSSWCPAMKFSRKSFVQLFGFGSKLLIAGVYAQIFNNIYNIVIGKTYSAGGLGYYTRAKTFTEAASGTISAIIQQVTYPILASLKNDSQRMICVYRRLIRITAFVVLPTMTLLAVLAEPIVTVLLTEKWLSVVPLMQWLCLARVVTPISSLNMNILNAIGRSDLFLKVDLAKMPLVVMALLITLPISIEAVVIGHTVTSLLSFFINAYLPGRYLGYGALAQLKDMSYVIIASILMGGGVLFLKANLSGFWLQIFAGSILGAMLYFIICFAFKVAEVEEFKMVLKSAVSKMRSFQPH